MRLRECDNRKKKKEAYHTFETIQNHPVHFIVAAVLGVSEKHI